MHSTVLESDISASKKIAPESCADLRVLYAAGAGDVLGTYRSWERGEDDPRQVVHTYSGQFFDLMREIGAEALVVTRFGEARRDEFGMIRIEQRPNPRSSSGGLSFHFGQILYGWRLLKTAQRMRANAAVICEGTTHWFMLPLFARSGVQVIPSCHSLLWPTAGGDSVVRRIVRRLSRRCFRKTALVSLVASGRIEDQVVSTAGGSPRPTIPFLPTYRSGFFEGISPPRDERPFKVLFIGRLEEGKGVFDLLEMARRLDAAGRLDIEFDLCGDGPARDELTQMAEQRGLADRFRMHGHCERSTMKNMLSACHAVIAPSRSTLVEGFNQVVVESILAGRPVLTSEACPAIDYVEDAAVRVRPDDVTQYVEGIIKLADEPEFYAMKCRACSDLQGQFYDESTSWKSAVRRALEMASEKKKSQRSTRPGVAA